MNLVKVHKQKLLSNSTLHAARSCIESFVGTGAPPSACESQNASEDYAAAGKCNIAIAVIAGVPAMCASGYFSDGRPDCHCALTGFRVLGKSTRHLRKGQKLALVCGIFV